MFSIYTAGSTDHEQLRSIIRDQTRIMGDIVDSTTRPDPIKRPDETPQQALNRFWKSFTSKKRGKPLTVLPQNDLAERLFETQPKDGVLTEPATANYDHAVAKCKAKVASIVKECRRINQKYCDAHFDLENRPMCLKPLTAESVPFCPGSILRVTEIFSDPQFFLDGVSSNDVRQGRNGDCWFLAAVAALSNVEGLMLKNCVARDEEVGVYGFVFHRGISIYAIPPCLKKYYVADLVGRGEYQKTASGSPRSLTISSTSRSPTIMTRATTGDSSKKRAGRAGMSRSTGKSTSPGPTHSILRNVARRTKPGCHCWRRPLPRCMGTTKLSTAATPAKPSRI